MSGAVWLPGERRTTVTVGTFDGVHRGHRAVLEEIVRRALSTGRASALVTFDPHPLEVVAPERAPCLLTTMAEKRFLWPQFGLDYVHVLRFTPALREMEPGSFVREILVGRLRVAELVIGYDHGFGKNRSGDVDTLRSLGGELGFDVDVVGPVESEGEADAVSSTGIRKAVAEGDLAAAARGLGRPYEALGEVVEGSGRGRELGFPTANLRFGPRKCLPPDGVYAVRIELGGERTGGMANLGPRPTFGEPERRFEVHLFEGPDRPLYGARPSVAFVKRLREVREFSGADELTAQLERDEAAARAALSAGRAGGVEVA
ncbi:MAG: bifunctional riboflavin kinase/FAD synthetase [Gemmatimonadota bacterium]|nr:bifunctional riboflavin kinase/FAD synthetase [Gemmatimonadota bacterium]